MATTSEKTDLLFPAIFEARKVFTKVEKDRQNGHLGNKYATLDSVLDMITPPLEQNSLWVEQTMLPETNAEFMRISTIIRHVSGQFIEYHTGLGIDKKSNQAQAGGSAFTYARRYALAACFGLSQADDDAELTKVSYKDYIKRIEKSESLEALKELFATAYRAVDQSSKQYVQEAYEKKKAEFDQEATASNGGGFRVATPQQRGRAKTEVETQPTEPVQSKPEPQDIESFE